MCHIVLLLPLFSLPVFCLWPLSLALPVYLLILLLSVWMYYYAIAAMRRKIIVGPESLLHNRGQVADASAGKLHVRVHSDLWGASTNEALKSGDCIEVVGVDGLMLRVQKTNEDGANALAHDIERGYTR